MTIKYFQDGKISRQRWRKAKLSALLELQPVLEEYLRMGWSKAVGASGTFKAAAEVLRLNRWSAEGITREGLARLKAAILTETGVDHLSLEGLDDQRKPVFPGGVVIIDALFEALDLQQLTVSDGALREGVVYDLAGRLHHNDIRERSVSSMAERFNVDTEQSRRVISVVNDLVLASQHYAPTREVREMLYWAGRLHEVGLTVAHSHFQKHGAYIIQHADLPGFSRQEQALLGFLVLAQRRKYPVDAYSSLTEYQRAVAIAPSVLLRLSLLLCRSRQAPDVSGLVLEWGPKRLDMRMREGWFAENPLCHADLKRELKYLKKADILLGFDEY